jgi:zinc protease
MKTTVSILMLAVLTAVLPAAFRPQDITVHKLENGLNVLLLEDHDIPNIAYYTLFRVGSRNERPGLTGVSHFIEHMMFNGTTETGPGEFDRRMEFQGGSNNAYTADDMTVYTDWFPVGALEAMVKMEADRMQGLVFDPKVLESERGVVASERRMAVDNDNDALLAETVRATAIMAHPYHWDVIGWMSDIQSWKRDEILAYYRTFYAPNNAVLVVVGDFNSASLMDLIRKYYGPIPASPPPPVVTTVEPEQLGVRRVEIRKEAQTATYISAFHTPAFSHADYPALKLLDSILLRGESSRLYRRLVSESQLAVEVWGGISETIDPQLFHISAKPQSGVDPARLEAAIDEELQKICREGVTEKELQKAKNAFRADFYQPLQTISGQANVLVGAELLYGDFARLFQQVDEMSAVSALAVKEACARYLRPANRTVGVLVPEGGAK